MKDLNNYMYHRDSRLDGRLKGAKAYREEAEKAELERELEEVASDIMDAMNEELDTILE